MARRKYEFRPDPTGFDWASKLLLTPKQQKSVLKWLLYSLVCVAGLVLQDSMLSRLRFLGGGFELAPALIILICVLEGCENGSVFALIGSMLYVLSGSGQDRYCIVLLTLAAVLAAAFRQSYLRRGAGSDLICVGIFMMLYELGIFAVGLFLELTYPGRWVWFVMTAILSTLTAGVLYRILTRIGTIGGNVWKE
jgi:hypothetical protein